MILKDNFFAIKNQEITDKKADFRINLNAEHFVYQSHFPNNPITPGVFLIQMVTELFDSLQERKFKINTVKNVKFTAPINPIEFPEVDFSLDFSKKEDLCYVKAVIKENETIFAKISIVLT